MLTTPYVCERGVSFLRHVGFYRSLIKDVSKTVKPFTLLLVKDTPFMFLDESHKAF